MVGGDWLKKAKASYGYGCGKIPCIYIIAKAGQLWGVGGSFIPKNKVKLLPIINSYQKQIQEYRLIQMNSFYNTHLFE